MNSRMNTAMIMITMAPLGKPPPSPPPESPVGLRITLPPFDELLLLLSVPLLVELLFVVLPLVLLLLPEGS